MKSLIIGIVILLAAIYMVLPVGWGWWGDVLTFLKGALPVLAAFIGLIAILIGIADIKDRKDAKKEEALEKR
ncbi:MAG: hypothetical protein LBG76_01365 [Treponema sp.]|nr:hypothetical protein [Treponema sp.]